MVRVRTPGPGTYSVPEYLKMGGSGAAATTVFGHATDKPKASAVFASGTEQGLDSQTECRSARAPPAYAGARAVARYIYCRTVLL